MQYSSLLIFPSSLIVKLDHNKIRHCCLGGGSVFVFTNKYCDQNKDEDQRGHVEQTRGRARVKGSQLKC